MVYRFDVHGELERSTVHAYSNLCRLSGALEISISKANFKGLGLLYLYSSACVLYFQRVEVITCKTAIALHVILLQKNSRSKRICFVQLFMCSYYLEYVTLSAANDNFLFYNKNCSFDSTIAHKPSCGFPASGNITSVYSFKLVFLG